MNFENVSTSDELSTYLKENIDKPFGSIKRYSLITLDRNKGFLIWDYNIFNEITFVNSKTKDYISLFASLNVDDTIKCFESLLKRYQINN